MGAIDVTLMLPDGKHFNGLARIRLLTQYGVPAAEGAVDMYGHTTIQGLLPNNYTVEASAAGFETITETVTLETKYSQVNVILTMKPEETEKPTPTKLAQPVLAPKARKELEKGVEAFRQKDIATARKHFEKALEMAPGDPDVQFLMGVLELEAKNTAFAEDHLQKAIQIFPNHVPALETLGEVYCTQGKVQAGLPLLEKAVSIEEGSWNGHWKLGEAYLQAGQSEKALHEAERAIALGKGAAGEAYVLKGEALANLGKWQEAEASLEKFIEEQPNDPAVASARMDLQMIRKQKAGAEARPTAPLNLRESMSQLSGLYPPVTSVKKSLWTDPGIDQFVPNVASNVSCLQSQVLARAGTHAEQLMASLERFSATEQVTHYWVDKFGELRSPQLRSYDYVVSLSRGIHGVIQVEEYRDRSLDPSIFPAQIATKGLPAMALIFLPQMATDFNFSCEGLGSLEGHPAWQVHFEQKKDRPSRIRAYVIAGNYHSVALKGRAWIDAGTFQVVRLESELVRPVPEIHLKQEHMRILYAPVQFHSRDVQLWLPQKAELYVEEDKLAFYRTHIFSNFQLFSVGTEQKIHTPKESYSFTNLSNQEIRCELTITPILERSITPVSITFSIPPLGNVIKTVGPGKDLNIPPDWIASARFVYNGAPGIIEGDALLTRTTTLEIVPETPVPPPTKY